MTKLERPKWNDKILEKLSEVIGKEIHNWTNDETSLPMCINISKEILRYTSIHTNGYELAKKFDDKGFNPDLELVEILDSLHYHYCTIQEEYIKDWVKENNLILKYKVGDIVISTFIYDPTMKYEYEVVEIMPDTYQYGIWFEGCNIEKGKGFRYVNGEDLDDIG